MQRIDHTLIGGQYEVALSIQDKEMADEYLHVCVKEAIHAGIDPKKAEIIERQNIIEFAKRFDRSTQRRVQVLFGINSH